MGTIQLSLLCLLFAVGTARAACPDRRASCVLHEEGVALFLEGKHEQAAAKFAAAIAAEPTARSYLGYAQAVEALGQIALAYDTMVNAQRMSQAEMQATGGKDVEASGRAERIKYKLGELRAKIGFVWLRVPEGVAPQRVISVQRQGEGDLSSPLTQWTAVAPGKQILIASIDDGTRLTLVAQVAAGSQGVVVIPIVASSQRPGVPIVRPSVPGTPGSPGIVAPMYKPPPPINTYISVGLSLAAPGPDNPRLLANVDGFEDTRASAGFGLTGLYEKKLVSGIAWTVRLEYLNHPKEGNGEFPIESTVDGWEIIALGGIRTLGSRTAHGRVGLGFTLYTQNAEGPTTVGGTGESFTRIYPAFEIGGGVHLGPLRIMMGVMLTASGDAEVGLGTRFMGTIGWDLYKK